MNKIYFSSCIGILSLILSIPAYPVICPPVDSLHVDDNKVWSAESSGILFKGEDGSNYLNEENKNEYIKGREVVLEVDKRLIQCNYFGTPGQEYARLKGQFGEDESCKFKTFIQSQSRPSCFDVLENGDDKTCEIECTKH